MATVIEVGLEPTHTLLEQEIQKAREEVRPISRRSLANTLVKARGLPYSEAAAMVDAYCDEKAPYTPDYLTKEFMLPYLKLAAMVFVVGSMVILGFGVQQQLEHKPSWLLFVAGATLFLFSGVGLLRILAVEREQ